MSTVEAMPAALAFFRRTPGDLATRVPLASSLQNFETSVYLIALWRYPHALVACASAIESSIKAMLGLAEDERRSHAWLVWQARQRYPALHSFANDIKTFRDERDRIVHYGFSPQDDDKCARLLLATGFRFLNACYTEFFSFPLADALETYFAEQFFIALEVAERVQALEVQNLPKPPGYSHRYCFDALGHFVRVSMKSAFLMGWQENAIDWGENFGQIQDLKGELESQLNPSWHFDCPICWGIDTFICEIDFGPEDQPATLGLTAGVCAQCGLVVHRAMPFLADRLCQAQVKEHGERLIREFGLGPKAER